MRALGDQAVTSLQQLAQKTGQGDLLLALAAEVALVEQELARQVESPVELVQEVCLHTLKAGGKRLRPAFVSLSAQATGNTFNPDRIRLLGACMEMIHMATLIHDDVIDNAATRRGRDTASSVYGNTAAILSGDVLLSRSMAILARDGDLEIIRAVSDAVVEMAEGEVRELELRNQFDVSETEHLEVLRMKTAAFIQCCCEIGCLSTGAELSTKEALKAYGYHIGLAFQIVDDLLDYRGTKQVTGKHLATDFREGCATLPLIYLSEELTDEEREVVKLKFGNGVTDDEIKMVVGWMDTRGAFSRAEALAAEHLEKGKSALSNIPQTPAKDILLAAADFILKREA